MIVDKRRLKSRNRPMRKLFLPLGFKHILESINLLTNNNLIRLKKLLLNPKILRFDVIIKHISITILKSLKRMRMRGQQIPQRKHLTIFLTIHQKCLTLSTFPSMDRRLLVLGKIVDKCRWISKHFIAVIFDHLFEWLLVFVWGDLLGAFYWEFDLYALHLNISIQRNMYIWR